MDWVAAVHIIARQQTSRSQTHGPHGPHAELDNEDHIDTLSLYRWLTHTWLGSITTLGVSGLWGCHGWLTSSL